MNSDRREEQPESYEELFILFSSRAERLILAVLLALLAGLILSQSLLQRPSIRYLLVKVEQLEGRAEHSGEFVPWAEKSANETPGRS